MWSSKFAAISSLPPRACRLAFEALNSNKKIIEHCIEINRIEDVTDDIVAQSSRRTCSRTRKTPSGS